MPGTQAPPCAPRCSQSPPWLCRLPFPPPTKPTLPFVISICISRCQQTPRQSIVTSRSSSASATRTACYFATAPVPRVSFVLAPQPSSKLLSPRRHTRFTCNSINSSEAAHHSRRSLSLHFPQQDPFPKDTPGTSEFMSIENLKSYGMCTRLPPR